MDKMPHITVLIDGKMAYAFSANRYSIEQSRDGKFSLEADCPPIAKGTDFGVPGQTGDEVKIYGEIKDFYGETVKLI